MEGWSVSTYSGKCSHLLYPLFLPLRSNLDPFDEYSDEDIWDSLKWVRMKDSVEALPEGVCPTMMLVVAAHVLRMQVYYHNRCSRSPPSPFETCAKFVLSPSFSPSPVPTCVAAYACECERVVSIESAGSSARLRESLLLAHQNDKCSADRAHLPPTHSLRTSWRRRAATSALASASCSASPAPCCASLASWSWYVKTNMIAHDAPTLFP